MAICANVDSIADKRGFNDGGGADEDVVGEFEGVVGEDSVESTSVSIG